MSKRTYSILKFRRGNTAVSNALTGAQGELFVDLQANTIVMHDGVTVGGHRITTQNEIINIQSINDSQNVFIQSAFDQANSANVLAQAAFDYANTITSSENAFIQSAFDQANSANVLAQAGYDQANTSISLSQNAYNQANTNANDIIIIQGINDTQNTDITNVNNLAQGAFDAANAIVIPSLGNYTFDGDTITNNIDENIILSTNDNDWTFGTDGNLIIPGGAKIGDIFSDGYGFGWQSPPNGGYAAITSNNISNYLAVDDDLLYTQVGDNRWSFESNGALTVPGDIIPNANNEYSLGSAEFQWKSLFISNNTIYIENVPLSLSVSNGGTYLITIGSDENKVNVASETFVQSFQNIDGGSSTAIYSYELLNLDGGGA